jgi:hypothetical protein
MMLFVSYQVPNINAGSEMTTTIGRLIASAIALVAGAIACSTENLNVNVGISLIVVASVLFVVDYIRSQKS